MIRKAQLEKCRLRSGVWADHQQQVAPAACGERFEHYKGIAPTPQYIITWSCNSTMYSIPNHGGDRSGMSR